MTEDNGHNGSPDQPADPGQSGSNGQRDAKGRLLPGHGGLPGAGRPHGSADPIKAMRELARLTGVPLEELAAGVLQSVSNRAVQTGDPACAKLLLDRVLGIQEKTQIAVGVQVDNANTGPPVPTGQDLKDYAKRLAEALSDDE